jgi:hypothetical protein
VNIAASSGDNVTCTYTNTERGRIRVLEAVSPVGDPQTFDFTLGGGPDAIASSFTLAGGSPAADTGAVRPGTYAIVQADDGPSWDLASATCDDGSPVGAVSVGPGEVVTCTFTNVKRGQVVVDEVTIPAGASQAFAYRAHGRPRRGCGELLADRRGHAVRQRPRPLRHLRGRPVPAAFGLGPHVGHLR